MKKILCIAFVTLLCTFGLVAACLSPSAFSTILFEADDAVTSRPSGYPRFSRLQDGTLLLVNSGAVHASRDGGKTWVRHTLTNGLETTYTSATTTHTLSRENWQGYVMPDGRLMVLYRARTKGDIAAGAEFYTSIRARIFTSAPDEYMNGSKSLTYGDERVLVERLATGFHGYWEPIVLQIAPDTLACYYCDDCTVPKPGTQQNIVYNLYTVSTGTWSEQNYVAIDGVSRNSRDGMPGVTVLADGTFAMVFEAFDYHNRSYNNTYGNAAFVISMSRSTDGRNWSTPIPIAAPQDITAGRRCAAPYMATLPDGRIVVSYMTDDLYVGSITGEYDRSRYCNSMLIVSNAVVTNTSAITATKGGVSSSFTSLGTPVTPIANGYQIWSSVSAFEGDLYFATSAGTNDGSVASSTQIRYAAVDPAMPIISVQNTNAGGSISVSVTKTSAGDGYKYYRSTDGGAFSPIATTAATSYTDTAIAAGHTYTYKVTSYRGALESEASAARSVTATVTLCAHSYDEGVITAAPTCTAAGARSCTCLLCGDTGAFTIPATGHTYDGGVVTAAPTCIATGVKTYTCTVCGNTRTEDVAATGHDFAAEYTVDLAPTCTAEGSKSQHCSRCDARQNQTAIPTAEHTYDGGVVTAAPQIGTRGVMTYTCTVCGHTLESEIPSLDEVTLAQTPVVEGEAYNEIAARAGEKEFAFVTLAADAESGATAGMVTLTGGASYIYRKNGVYLTPVDFTENGDGVRFVGSAGEQIVSSAEPLVLFGDINADSHLTLSDVLRGFRYLADRTVTIDCAATDLSGNCFVELLDLLLTLRQILGD
ncbi:MAG: hypothetical protein IJU41_02775 [Clostridia bacterium]|nr:hypothetical protein [Clostridia bacterium]